MFRTVLTMILLTAGTAQASEEGILALSSFRLESAGIGQSGKIVVEGRENKKWQVVNLKISAFGKDYVIPKEKLAGLAELSANGVRISYEGGYPMTGGRTIYIQFQMGFTSWTKQKALVTVSENGRIDVGKVETEEPKEIND